MNNATEARFRNLVQVALSVEGISASENRMLVAWGRANNLSVQRMKVLVAEARSDPGGVEEITTEDFGVMVRLAVADGTLSQAERTYLNKVAKQFGWSEQDVRAYLNTLSSGAADFGKVCPKCGHQRPVNSKTPEWQCPSCGVVYDKYEQVLDGTAKLAFETAKQNKAAEKDERIRVRSTKNMMRFMVFIMVLSFSGFIYSVIDNMKFLEEALHTTGTVTRIQGKNTRCEISGNPPRRYDCTDYSALVEFTTAEGTDKWLWISSGSVSGHNKPVSNADHRVNDRVNVVYSPDQSGRVDADTLMGRWGSSIFLLGIFMGALVLWVKGRSTIT